MNSWINNIMNRKATEEALRESEERYRTLVASVNDAIILQEKTGEILTWNRAAERLFGVTAGEVLGHTATSRKWKTIREDGTEFPDSEHPSMHTLATGGACKNVVMGITSAEGRFSWVNVNTSPLFRQGDAKPYAVVISLLDITERKQAEEAVQYSETRFKELFNNMSSGVAVYEVVDDGADFVFVDFNRAAETIDKIKKEDIIGRRVSEVFPGVGEFGLLEVFCRVWRTGQSEQHPITQYKDERIAGWRDNFIYRLPSGEIVAVYHDVTERKRAEEALRESEEKFRSLAESSPDYIMRYDRQCRHTYMNPAALRVSGLTEDKIIGKTHRESGFDESLSRFWEEKITGVFESGKQYQTQFAWESAEGRVVLDWMLTPEFSVDGTVRSVLGVSRNITQLKKAEEELLKKNEELKDSYEQISASKEVLRQNYDELTRQEQKLRESEAKYRLIADNTADNIWIFDMDMHLQYISPSVEKMKGFTVEEALSQSLEEAMTPESLESLMKRFHQEMVLEASGTADPHRIVSFETEEYCKSGATILVENSVTLIRDAQGRPVRMLGISRDITGRKRAEEALRKSEEKYRLLIEKTDEGVWIIDKDYRTTFVNNRLAAMFGSTPQEMIGKQVLEFMPAEDMQVHGRRIRERLEGKSDRFEQKFVRKDGSAFWVIASVTVLEEENRFVGAFAMLTDITERKRAEEALQESEAKYRTIFENTGTAMVIVEESNIISLANKEFAQLIGFSKDDIEGKKSWTEFVVKEDLERMLAQHRLRRQNREKALTHYEFRTVTKSGDIRTIYLSIDMIPGTTKSVASLLDITGRKRAEEALRETNEYLHKLIDYASAPIIVWDPRFRITRFNDAFDLLTGRTEQEVIGQPLDILFPEESRDTSLALIKKTLEGERWESVKIPILAADGTIHTVLWNSANILTANAELVSTIAQGVDITQSERAEGALRESEKRYRAVVEDQTELICRFAPNGTLTFVNDAYCRNFGLNKDRCIGSRNSVVLPVDDARQMKKHLAELTPENPVGFIEHRIIMPSGEVRWQRWSDRAFFDKDGHVVEYQSVGNDITERKRAEGELRENEERIRWLASFPELNPNPVIEMDAQGTITFANASTQKTLRELGLPEDPVLFVPKDKDEILRLLRETDEPQVYREITLNNETFAENISLNRALNVVRIYTLNITRQKRAEQERERFLAELEQKNAELERFTYTVSHDLKSPLITIRGFLGLLEEDALKDDTVSLKKDINRIKSATNTMEDLLRDLLTLSRIGRIVSPPAMVSFKTIAEDAVELLEGAIRQREVTVEIAPDMPVVNVDRDRVREAVMNLVENAIKFMGDQPHPKIGIGVRYDRDQPVFFVKDNGIGIDPQYHKKIFGLFEKLSVNTEGSGTGLAIVQRIIEVHGCRIWVESAGANQGSTFYFSLPVAGADGTDTHKNEEKAE